MAAARDHSTLMLAARITLAHFSVSSRISLPKSSGEPRKHHAAEVGEPRLYLRIGKRGIDLGIELLDDRSRRVLGRNEPDPLARLETRNELAERRNVRQRLRARRGRHRQRAQVAGLDVPK